MMMMTIMTVLVLLLLMMMMMIMMMPVMGDDYSADEVDVADIYGDQQPEE